MNALTYETECEANKVLEILGPIFIELPHVIYICVIKKEDKLLGNRFKIEFGIDKSTSLDLNNCIQEQIINKNLILDQLVKNSLSLRERFLIAEPNNYDKLFYDLFKNAETQRISRFSTKEREKHEDKRIHLPPCNPIRGGLPIAHRNLRSGTLGGVFELEGYEGEYFGISNWHVLARDYNLGSEIFQPGKPHFNRNIHNIKDYLCGHLFWKLHDSKREVAFVHFDTKRDSFEEENICGYELKNGIGTSILGDDLKKCGSSTLCNFINNTCTTGITHAVKSYVKVDKSIYKNQILVKNSTRDFTDNGDSGSLIVNAENKIVGLHFASTIDEEFSVANNINYIFGSHFSSPQVVCFNGQTQKVNQFKIKKFY